MRYHEWSRLVNILHLQSAACLMVWPNADSTYSYPRFASLDELLTVGSIAESFFLAETMGKTRLATSILHGFDNFCVAALSTSSIIGGTKSRLLQDRGNINTRKLEEF